MSRRGVSVLACVLFVAGCIQPEESSTDAGAPAGGVGWREHEHLGPVLVDHAGRTLYVFAHGGVHSSFCEAACESWPLATPEGLESTDPAVRSRLSTFWGPGGSSQLTIDGRPLYRYVGDAAPGDVNGQARGATWFVVRRSDAPGTLNADFLDGPGEHDVLGANVTYGSEVVGHLARPTNGSGFPGVVMIHEWWGLNDHIRKMADALASHGYVVLAVDLFGSVATEPQQAREQVVGLDQAAATADMRSAVRYLREEAGATSVASLGWCFGGAQSLRLALSGEPLDATVIYYGQLDTDPANLSAIGWPVLGIFGADDASIPLTEVRAFESGLAQAGVEAEIHVYEGVGHAFANPSGSAYAPEKAMQAWARTLDFLARSR